MRRAPDLRNLNAVMSRMRSIESRFSRKSPPKVKFSEIMDKNDLKTLKEVTVPKSELSSSGSVIRSLLLENKEKDLGWQESIDRLSKKYGVDEKLVRSVIWAESRGKVDAVSPKGALGLMQLMPSTAKMLGVDPNDPIENLEGGIKYLSILSEKYNGDLEKTLAAYNAGPGRVDRYDGVPPFRETKNYVSAVLERYRG